MFLTKIIIYGHGDIILGSARVGNTSNYYSPVRVSSVLDNVNIAKICEAYHSAFILTDDGEIWSWGWATMENI